jgi:hypothetical protein
MTISGSIQGSMKRLSMRVALSDDRVQEAPHSSKFSGLSSIRQRLTSRAFASLVSGRAGTSTSAPSRAIAVESVRCEYPQKWTDQWPVEAVISVSMVAFFVPKRQARHDNECGL